MPGFLSFPHWTWINAQGGTMPWANKCLWTSAVVPMLVWTWELPGDFKKFYSPVLTLESGPGCADVWETLDKTRYPPLAEISNLQLEHVLFLCDHAQNKDFRKKKKFNLSLERLSEFKNFMSLNVELITFQTTHSKVYIPENCWSNQQSICFKNGNPESSNPLETDLNKEGWVQISLP